MDTVDYAVTRKSDEERYTLGVLYVPGARDSDNEFIDSDELQKAAWDYMRSGYRGVRDTHTEREIGELVELITWPFPVDVDTRTGKDGEVLKYRLPAGSVFAGVVWTDEVWPLVKSGKVRGYSLGGRAIRLKEAADDEKMPRMAELRVTKDQPGGPIPNDPNETNWVEETGGLPRYIRQIAEDLIPKHGVSGAIRLAVGIVKRWCSGRGNVTAKTRAKACKAVAEWNAMRARAAAKTEVFELTDEELDTAEAEVSPEVMAALLDESEDE